MTPLEILRGSKNVNVEFRAALLTTKMLSNRDSEVEPDKSMQTRLKNDRVLDPMGCNGHNFQSFRSVTAAPLRNRRIIFRGLEAGPCHLQINETGVVNHSKSYEKETKWVPESIQNR